MNKRFSGSSSTSFGKNNKLNKRESRKKTKKFERTLKLSPDSTLMIKHGMNVKNVTVTAKTTDGKRFQVKFKVKDNNNVEILNKGDQNIKFTITEVAADAKKSFWNEFAQYGTRFLMSVRSFSVKYRTTRQLSGASHRYITPSLHLGILSS